ncbi:MAG: FMN-binding protein, partial [Prevotella sp.]|nr:FMN-binding protein [Prevotella sp.]
CLGVKKPSNIKLPNSEVDCVTGATLTSDGVDAMLKESLAKYKNHMLHTPDF